MTRLTAWRALIPLVAASALVAGCSASGSSGGVASVAGSGTTGASATPAPQGNTEEQLLSYVQCLRGQGLDIPDPQVDAEGNLRLGPPRGAGQGGGGRFDPSRFQAAQEVCGQPPAGALGGGRLDQTEFQDAALKFAQCMRERGVDVPDPDFSSGAGPGAVGGLFGRGLDNDDPKVQTAREECRGAFANVLPGAGSG